MLGWGRWGWLGQRALEVGLLVPHMRPVQHWFATPSPPTVCSHLPLQSVDLEELHIWHGQSVSLGLEADGQPYRFVVQSEPEWRSLKEVLPAAQVRWLGCG